MFPQRPKNSEYPKIDIFLSCKNFQKDKVIAPYYLKVFSEDLHITTKTLQPLNSNMSQFSDGYTNTTQ